MVSQESGEKYVGRNSEVVIRVEFYWEVELGEDSQVCTGFKDTKNTGDQDKGNFNEEETQGSSWTAMLPGNATPSKMPQMLCICIFIALLKYLDMVA